MKFKIALFIIILIAIFLRLANIEYMEFKNDEAKNSFLTVNLIKNKVLPLMGDTASTGVHHPAMFIYLLTIPFMLSYNPVIAAIYIVLLNILAVYICYLFCSEFFNKTVALLATAFFAINPWAIFYSRKIWAEDVLPLFVLACFYFLYKVIFKQHQKYIIYSFITLAIFTQLHASSFYFLISFFIILAISKPKIKIKYYLLSALAFLVLYIPYALYIFQNRLNSLKVLSGFIKFPLIFQWQAFIQPFILSSTKFYYHSNVFFDNIQILLLIGGIIYLIYNYSERKNRILLIWFFVPLFLMSITKIPPCPHYFISFFPIQFIIIGIFIDFLIKKTEKIYKLSESIVIMIILVIMLNQAFCSFDFFINQIKTNKNIDWMGYGPPFKHRVKEIKLKMKEGYAAAKDIHAAITNNQEVFKYDYQATKYIVENINVLR